MPDDSPQLEMLGNRAAQVSVEVQEELARGCRSRHHALVKCYEVSNLTPKQVYGPLGLTQSTFSRIISGDAFLPHNMKGEFMDLCGNLIPIRYDVWKADHEMRPVQSTLEKQLETTRKELAQERLLNRRLVEMYRGR